jgi:hypothetical protein
MGSAAKAGIGANGIFAKTPVDTAGKAMLRMTVIKF